MVILSLFLHGAGVLLVLGVEQYAPRRSFDPQVISVRLVGPAEAGAIRAVGQPAPIAPHDQPPAPQSKEPTPQKRIPVAVPQAERKTVSINPSEVKPPERASPQKIEPLPPRQAQPASPAKEGGQATAGLGPKAAGGPTGGGGGDMGSEEARYLQMLQQRIEENWKAYLPPEQGVLGEVRIRISPDGGIREFSFLKGSGKSHVDASIVSAIKKVVLPPPPSSLADRPLVLRFWPSGPHP
jgi:outer membrane biosynthesis protein TonB